MGDGMLLALLLAVQTALPEHGELRISAPTYSTSNGASLSVQVTRTLGTSGIVGCSYQTVNGTAIAGTDYTSTSGTLSWGSGDGTSKTISIPILNGTGNKSFGIRLYTPTGGAFLGVPPSGKNHEGRTLPAYTPPGTSIHWHTPEADAILAGLQIMPPNNPWNEDISQRPVASNSSTMIGLIGSGTAIALNRDMNFAIVPSTQAKKNVTLVDYPDESDPGPYPVPDNGPIENWPVDDTRTLANVQQDLPEEGGDRHLMSLDPAAGFFYEFWQMKRNASFAWTASNNATFNFRSNQLRPDGWTSGDAAGLPILPSIPRFDECERGMVEHALRFTVQVSRRAYVYPATHYASSNTDVNRPRMGERFRLKKNATIDAAINGMAKHPKAIALALQKYGMFMADNGGNWRISAGADPRLTNLSQLTQFHGSDFEVIVPTGPNEGPRQYSAATVTIGGGGGGGDTSAPAVTISSPTSAATHSTSTAPLSLGGSASDNVGVSQVSWVNGAQSGTATGTTSWTASVPLTSGSNTIVVTARDAANNSSTDTITVTYTPADTAVPAVSITGPTSGTTHSTSSTPLALSGGASDNVGVSGVTWSNAGTGGGGTAAGTTSWSASIPLNAGSNAITVTARDAAGNSSTDTITVTYTPPAGDTTPPTISISSPTSGGSWTAAGTPLALSGSAGDNVGVSTVTWTNAATGDSGSASGTTSWSASIPLAAGANPITVRALDAAGNPATDTLTATWSSGTVSSGGDSGDDGGCSLSTITTGGAGLPLAALALLLALRRRR